MVRSLLNGRFENTAFCIFAPDGKTRLSGTGRSPRQGFGLGRSSPEQQNADVIRQMNKIAVQYPERGSTLDAEVQDFHSFKQALNVASGDQRLLVFVVAPERKRKILTVSMRKVMNHPDVLGRYHLDFADKEDLEWANVIEGEKEKSGIFVVRSGAFGQDGRVMAELPLDASPVEIRKVLNEANGRFAESEKRKQYADHVSQGRREGVRYEDKMPWGEDRDADGKIDEGRRHRGSSHGRRRP